MATDLSDICFIGYLFHIMRRLGNPIYEPDEDFDLGEEVLEK